MKKNYTLLLFTVLAAVTSACSEGNTGASSSPVDGNVRIAAAIPTSSRGPVFTADEFRILVFRNTATDYAYAGDIPSERLRYDGTTLSGTAQLPAGEYKFLPSYGLMSPGNYAWPELSGATLGDDLYITHTGESFPEAFMLNSTLDAVPSYPVSLDGPKQTVSTKLRRAVSRVDVLFLRADKDPSTGNYTEKQGDDVFGPEKLSGVKFTYTDANSRLGLSGEKVQGVFDAEHTLASAAEAVTMGTGTSTTVGTDGYDFGHVLPADIVAGSAHLKGTYLIPNADNTATTGFSMELTSGEGTTRTIALDEKIPVERNKATLIRIYVLGDNVFTTGVDFEVTVDTVWDGSTFVDGEID